MVKVAGQQRQLSSLPCPAGRRNRPAALGAVQQSGCMLLFLHFGLFSSSQMNQHTHFLSELNGYL